MHTKWAGVAHSRCFDCGHRPGDRLAPSKALTQEDFPMGIPFEHSIPARQILVLPDGVASYVDDREEYEVFASKVFGTETTRLSIPLGWPE